MHWTVTLWWCQSARYSTVLQNRVFKTGVEQPNNYLLTLVSAASKLQLLVTYGGGSLSSHAKEILSQIGS